MGCRLQATVAPVPDVGWQLTPSAETASLRTVLLPGEPAPDFQVETVDGWAIDSGQLVGRRAFAVVVFATWCEVCGLELPIVLRASRDQPEVSVIGVATDSSDTWHELPAYLARHGITFPIVQGSRYPHFTARYGAASTIPAIAVVGRSGMLVDHRVGFRRNDAQGLKTAFARAAVPES